MAIEEDVEHFIVEAERSINQRGMAADGRLFSEDLAMRAPGVPGEAMGREARVQFVQGILKTFPDGRIEGVRAFGQGDRGCIQFRFKGTNTGPLATPDGGEAPPTNRSVEFAYCVVAIGGVPVGSPVWSRWSSESTTSGLDGRSGRRAGSCPEPYGP